MPLSAVAPTPKPPAAPAAVTAQCNHCIMQSPPTRGEPPPHLRSPYPGVNQKMHPLLIPQPAHRQHDAVNAICYHSTPQSSLPLPPHPAPTAPPRARRLAPFTEPRTTSLNEPSSHPFSYPGVNQKPTTCLACDYLPTHLLNHRSRSHPPASQRAALLDPRRL